MRFLGHNKRNVLLLIVVISFVICSLAYAKEAMDDYNKLVYKKDTLNNFKPEIYVLVNRWTKNVKYQWTGNLGWKEPINLKYTQNVYDNKKK